MHWNRSTSDINEDLNQALAFGIEAGTRPHTTVGFSRTVLDGLLGATAVDRLAMDRRIPLGATVSTGGSGLLWLYLFTGRSNREAQTNRAEEAEPTVTDAIIYTGADAATQMASMATLAPRMPHLFVNQRDIATQTESVTGADPKMRHSGLATEHSLYLTPTAEPMAIAPFDAQPFTAAPLALKPILKHANQPTSAGSEQAMVRAAAAIIACALVAAALIFS